MHEIARYSLAGIRLVNGAVALLAPHTLAQRLGIATGRDSGASYTLPLFGVRTVLLGAELLFVKDGAALNRSLRLGTLIHASDVIAAARAGRNGDLPPRAAAIATAISSVNVALTFLAREPSR
ncbi:hypothetical protein ACFC1R_30820 [Kitasatospora sp. NPDC056138]|uniref:hypothetical protein n=1 Tax=Kitasatospora sp. NPDC056138 TaxID=3345724 RepID=UPI0035D61311